MRGTLLGRFLPVLIAIALDLAAFGMAFTDIALRARSYGAAPWFVGLILSSYFLFQIVMSPRWGAVGDRLGRKPVAVACTALSAASMVVYALVPNLTGIILSRVLAGFAAANVAVVQASVASATTNEDRSKAMGWMSAAINAGLIVGFAGGGFIANHGPFAMGMTGAALSTVGTVLLAVWMPSTPPANPSESEARHGGLSLLKEHPLLARLFMLTSVSWFSLACLEGTFAQLLQDLFRQDQRAFGLILMLEMLLGFLLQSLLFSRITKRWGTRRALVAGYILQGVGLGLTPFMPVLALLIAVSSLYALGKGLADPCMNLLTSEQTPSGRQGEMFGLLQSARNIGFLGGPSLGGFLYGIAPAIPYGVAGVISLAAAVMALGLASPSFQSRFHNP